jgi:hypothetical protein
MGPLAVGTTGLDGCEPMLEPWLLAATTENVYVVPLVRPLTVQLVAGALTVQVAPPGLAVTV